MTANDRRRVQTKNSAGWLTPSVSFAHQPGDLLCVFFWVQRGSLRIVAAHVAPSRALSHKGGTGARNLNDKFRQGRAGQVGGLADSIWLAQAGAEYSTDITTTK